jgi:hypothetical protein
MSNSIETDPSASKVLSSNYLSEATNPTSKLAKWLSDLKKKYKFSVFFDLVNLILSIACIVIYIYSTYDPSTFMINKSFFWFNFLCRVYFVCDFAFHLLTEKSEKIFDFYKKILTEVVTSVPYIFIRLIIKMEEDFTNDIYMITSAIICLRIYRIEYISNFFQSEVNKQLCTISCSILSLLTFSTAMINVIENTQTVGKYWLFLPRDCYDTNMCVGSNDHFHSTFFFVLTTVATIGYNSNINSVAGRIVIIFLILASLIQIPAKCSELMTLLSSKSIYSRTTYKKLDKVNYILITGNISYGSMVDLLNEYFHPDHGENERHALILMPQRPDPNMKSLLQEYSNKLYYFEGDPLKESDLRRCQFKDSSTIILLCNKQTDDSNAEDSKTILQAMAIRKYLVQEEESKNSSKVKLNPETRMLIQLLRPESELHFSLSISKKNTADQILCIDELKLSLLAKSCLCNGIIALVSNLIMTSNLENIDQKLMEENKWLDEYKRGKGYEIYKIQLDYMRGYTFNEISEMVYSEKSIILFGMNIESKVDGTCLVLLNPNDMELPNSMDVIIYGYCLAENKKDADDVVVWSQGKKKAHIKVPDRQNALSPWQTTKRLNTSIGQNINNKRRNGMGNGEDFHEVIEEEPASYDEKDNEFYSTDAITFSKICHITTEPIDKASVTMQTVENMLIARNHIIICGISQNFIDFIKPLRAKYLPKSECVTIVILCKEIPDDKLWSTIAFFDQIYLVQGDPLNKGDLKRAGIRFANKVVILAPGINEISHFTSNQKKRGFNQEDLSKQARKLTREEEDLLDSKTIFKYNMISKIKKDTFIIIELINPKNVSFLYNKGREQNDEYRFIKSKVNIDGTASFAAGEVYFSSIMDNLITQAYYNQSLLSVLKKLILGEDQSAYKKPPLNRYKNIVSANLYLIDIPQEENEKRFNQFTDNSASLLRNFTNDVEIGGVKKLLFKDMFIRMLKRKITVIGIYRSIESQQGGFGVNRFNTMNNIYLNYSKVVSHPSVSNFYYVCTSPPPDFEIHPKDKLFVLSQVFPEEEVFNPENRKINKMNEEGGILTHENNQFNKFNKKQEEKKENTKIFDQTGENKIKEVNSSLKETLQQLQNLKNYINISKEKIDRTLVDSVKNKINDIFKQNKLEASSS